MEFDDGTIAMTNTGSGNKEIMMNRLIGMPFLPSIISLYFMSIKKIQPGIFLKIFSITQPSDSNLKSACYVHSWMNPLLEQ